MSSARCQSAKSPSLLRLEGKHCFPAAPLIEEVSVSGLVAATTLTCPDRYITVTLTHGDRFGGNMKKEKENEREREGEEEEKK
ncbi:hypothetical protein JOB18_045725 [Solea senegalensis]|uniref:Uncharacterized protein n=1 Tax=Solea senegalensis TaxID=28829 RepID=A0AAV6RF58_SOLSE|nr:hypothetical protein JOB18_045725 [Solea senegalensis]